MAAFWKKSDPIQTRAKMIDRQIAELESKIKSLAGQNSVGSKHASRPNQNAQTISASDPIGPIRRPTGHSFEDLSRRDHPKPSLEDNTPAHYNEFGLRKFDIIAAWRKISNHIYGPTSNNPHLVNFLAAGSIKGLRPLRYEKKVARNRFLAFFSALLLVLYGLIYFFMRMR